jgi:hypothetical protein
MNETYTFLVTAAVALALLVVLRWIFTPRRTHRDPAPHPPPAAGADDAWDGAARRRRDLAT